MHTGPHTGPSSPILAALGIMMLVGLVTGCQKTQKAYPGPCEGHWIVRETVNVFGMHLTLPIAQGGVRIMRFAYDKQGRLIALEDDDDGDGTPESRISIAYDAQGRVVRESMDLDLDGDIDAQRDFEYLQDEPNPVVTSSERQPDGQFITRTEHDARPMRRIWQKCHGECSYDDFGNILEDRDRRGQDILTYHYGCWSP